MSEKSQLEQRIFDEAKNAIGESIVKQLSAFNSPLNELAKQVVSEHSDAIKQVMRDAMGQTVNSDEFKKEVIGQFVHRLAKTFVGDMDSVVSKTTATLKSDPVFRSRAILAMEQLIEETLTNRQPGA
jgi:DNA-binding FrmR family transcriptional regulator